MTELEVFAELKKEVLLTYQKYYPYFSGTWKNFSSKDILQLIDLIEKEQRNTVSEKWIYTHLKPDSNEKLPRKDMLDIFSKFSGYSGWDEFHSKIKNSTFESSKAKTQKTYYKNWSFIIPAFFILGLGLFFWLRKSAKKEISITNAYSGKEIPNDEIKVYDVTDSIKKNLTVEEKSTVKTEKDSLKIVIESPFYQSKIVNISADKSKTEIQLQPNDNAMMIKAFLSADIKDWQTRKKQLENILSEDTEVVLMLRDNLGSEYFDKQDFIKQILIPTARIKKWKIVELKNETGKINFIRIQEE
ncbi:MAG: hypothetical protein DI529_14350 [Chryseobacterium sp.]|nr:MAG: hypothetical protein DI529_14350 [Chryseobacterium sp.]